VGQSILIIEDEDSLRRALDKFFQRHRFDVVLTSTGEEGLELLKKRVFDLMIVDLMLPKMSGIEVVRQAKLLYPSLVPIVMTGYGTIPTAIEAIKAGAFHYVTKPFDLDDLNTLVGKAIEHRHLQQENQMLRQALKDKFRMENIIGMGPKMQEVFSLVERVAASDSTILILGESGTGKELLAKAVHFSSPRSDRPLVTVNCAAIPDSLLESELFGHMKGAFTGAVSTRIGRFEQADGGTIFLDEIGDMSPHLQVKVLRVLQDRIIQPVGSTKSREVDVRILTATNRDLARAVRDGHFREDLFYRLNVIPISLPPLRDRREDIPLLLEHFLKKTNEANQKSVEGFAPQALERLVHYDWPGNIRELENMVERLVVLKGAGKIEATDLVPSLFGDRGHEAVFEAVSIPEGGLSFRDLISQFEDTLIRKALQKSGGNKNRAAQLLRLNRTTLIEKMKKKGFEVPSTEEENA